MLEIYFNTTSREAFDADGNQFRSGMPRLAYMSRDMVRVILCSETPENDNAGADPSTWTRDTSYNVAGIGAMLTVDSDYIHKLKGELAAEVPAGSVSSVTATIASASYAKIPSSGVLRLFDAYGNYEALSYAARSIEGTSVTFTTSGTLAGTYETGAMDCDQSPYCSAMLDTAASNVEEGEFVFQLVVNSDRLREEMDYTDTEKLSVKGLEILLYKTTDGTDETLNAFVCDTFSIVGTIGAVGFESDPPDGTENKLAGVVDQLLAAGFEVEQQYDSAGNTQFRFRSVEAGGTWSAWVTVNKGQDRLPCSLTVGTVTTGEPGTNAEVEITGEGPNQIINFKIPRGNAGESASGLFLEFKNAGSLLLKSGTALSVGDVEYSATADVELDVADLLDTGTIQAGKDYCVYITTDQTFVVSLNSTFPSGTLSDGSTAFSAENTRKIGGFHTLCADAGEIDGHPLSGFSAGDILPASVWCLNHRPYCEPAGMVYCSALDFWVDIYLQSGTGEATASVFGGTITHTRCQPDHIDDMLSVRKKLLSDEEFSASAAASNQQTAISGAAAPATTGGNTDTAGRRMISAIGCEDCCGGLGQFLADISAAGKNGWNGETYGTAYVLVAGGNYANGQNSGPTSRFCNCNRNDTAAILSARGMSPNRTSTEG